MICQNSPLGFTCLEWGFIVDSILRLTQTPQGKGSQALRIELTIPGHTFGAGNSVRKKIPQYFTASSLWMVGESLDLQLLPVAMVSIFPPRVMSTYQPSALPKKGKWWGYGFCPGSPKRVIYESSLSTQVTMVDDSLDCIPCLRLKGQGIFKIPFQFSPSVMSDSLQSHGLQHARLPCPSPTPRAYSNSCPLSQWCHPTISSSVVLSSSHLQSFPASGWPKYWSFSISISPSNEYSGLISFRMDWLDLLEVQGTLKSLLQHHSSKPQFFSTQLSL